MTEWRRILWRRLDRPGHEVARLARVETGWRLEGHVAGDRALGYSVDLNSGWQVIRAEVSGWGPEGALSFKVERSMMGGWAVDGAPRADLATCTDIDLGFTPGTNTLAIRRLDLEEGAEAAVTALWLDEATWTVSPLPQTYARTGPRTWTYRSEGFAADLTLSEEGFVTDYPGLWLAEG